MTNAAARLAADWSRPSRVALLVAGVPLVRLFAPEHGLTADGEDGAPMRDGDDPVTGLPIVSLYGQRFAPPAATLADLDLVLFDVPDVGARFYTYLWTLSHVLESCAHTETPLVVLDRPNPLGGTLASAEGPMLDEERCSSFIGRWPIPIRHSLTLGELARHWRATRVRGARLSVVQCTGWSRDQRWPALTLPWVPSSPAMPSYESARLYPGLCLFEGTTLSVGRGTDAPFQRIAAPWLQPEAVIEAMTSDAASGVRLTAEEVTPTEGPHAGQRCRGVHLTVTDEAQLRPVALALMLLAAVIRLHRPAFGWSRYPTAANPTGGNHFARLVGRADIAARLESADRPVTRDEIAQWTDARSWSASVGEALLYG